MNTDGGPKHEYTANSPLILQFNCK